MTREAGMATAAEPALALELPAASSQMVRLAVAAVIAYQQAPAESVAVPWLEGRRAAVPPTAARRHGRSTRASCRLARPGPGE
jgi:hypothetical protein